MKLRKCAARNRQRDCTVLPFVSALLDMLPLRPLLHWLAGLVLLAILAVAGASSAFAQEEQQGLEQKVTELEQKVLLLESELAQLRERLETLVPDQFDQRVRSLPPGDSQVQGELEAQVTLVMFGDYQSDYSARAQHAIRQVLRDFPNRVRYIYKHYPLTQLHPLANDAALAALAAERQGRFWEYHDQLFLNTRRLDANVLLVLAEQVGLDLSRFNVDRNSLWALGRLSEDEKLATAAGLTGVPSVFLNGRPMTTWRYDYLRQQVARLLEATPR